MRDVEAMEFLQLVVDGMPGRWQILGFGWQLLREHRQRTGHRGKPQVGEVRVDDTAQELGLAEKIHHSVNTVRHDKCAIQRLSKSSGSVILTARIPRSVR